MAHQSNTTALGRAAEEGHLDLAVAQLLAVVHHAVPGLLPAGRLVVFQTQHRSTEGRIRFDDAAEADLEQGGQRRAEAPAQS